MSDTTSLTPGPLPSDPRKPRNDLVQPNKTHITDGPLPAGAAPSDSDARPANARFALRVWPGVILVLLQWAAMTAPGWLAPGTMWQVFGMFYGPMVFGAAILLWWSFASRQAWRYRLLGILSFILTGAIGAVIAHPSTRMGMVIFLLPLATTAWVGWMLLARRFSPMVQQVGLLVAFALCWGYYDLLRFEGVDGNFSAEMAWRWTPTAEERYLAERQREAATEAVADPARGPLMLQAGDWPAFRGPDRDGKLTGVRIATNWKEQPPKLLWKHLVGPGWSSFAVIGNRFFTQEQRATNEVVFCGDTETGKEVWVHEDKTRFSEAVGGPGPRATPTFHEGKLYVMGASGKLNCLDAATGKAIWTRDIKDESGQKDPPMWGFASSPLIVRGMVIVYAGGADGKSLLAYKADSGEPAWQAGDLGHSYCSPHLAKLGGVEQVIVTGENGMAGFDPEKGQMLWWHDWKLQKDMARVVQPTVLSSSDVLVGTGFGFGTRRVRLSRKDNAWSDEEIWTTRKFNPYFNDLVIFDGHLFGFDSGGIFTCVSLEDANRRWATRGYGNGQVLLLADQGLLLVLSEKGEAALLKATPDKHEVLGKFQAIKGKTWNHPVVAHGKLFVRNDKEAACFELRP